MTLGKSLGLGVALLIAGLATTFLAQGQTVDPASRQIFACFANASTATTLTALGGQCVAPGTRRSLYITDIFMGGSVNSGTTADSAPTLKYGTGGSCGSGTVAVTAFATLANTTNYAQLSTPLKIAANNELCWIFSPAGTKWVTVLGYIDKG